MSRPPSLFSKSIYPGLPLPICVLILLYGSSGPCVRPSRSTTLATSIGRLFPSHGSVPTLLPTTCVTLSHTSPVSVYVVVLGRRSRPYFFHCSYPLVPVSSEDPSFDVTPSGAQRPLGIVTRPCVRTSTTGRRGCLSIHSSDTSRRTPHTVERQDRLR